MLEDGDRTTVFSAPGDGMASAGGRLPVTAAPGAAAVCLTPAPADIRRCPRRRWSEKAGGGEREREEGGRGAAGGGPSGSFTFANVWLPRPLLSLCLALGEHWALGRSVG